MNKKNMSESFIGILGCIGSGKTTAAQYIQRHHKFKLLSVAEPLRQLGIIFGFKPHQIYGTQQNKLEIHPRWGISSRRFLQVMGTEVFRDYVPQVLPDMKIQYGVWIDLMIHKIKDRKYKRVVTDIRFPDEVKMVKDMGGVVIRLRRDLPDGTADGSGHNPSQHVSERVVEQSAVDYEFNNNGTLEELYAFLDGVVQKSMKDSTK